MIYILYAILQTYKYKHERIIIIQFNKKKFVNHPTKGQLCAVTDRRTDTQTDRHTDRPRVEDEEDF